MTAYSVVRFCPQKSSFRKRIKKLVTSCKRILIKCIAEFLTHICLLRFDCHKNHNLPQLLL